MLTQNLKTLTFFVTVWSA